MPIVDSNTIKIAFPFHDKSANYLRRLGQWQGPASYTTGGEIVDWFAALGFARVSTIIFQPFYNGSQAVLARFTPGASPNEATAGTIMYFDFDGNQLANGTALSGFTAQFEAIGR